MSDADAPIGEVTSLLSGVRQGDGAAVQRLCEILYHDLRRVARARLRANRPLTQLDTTALVHESFIRLVNQRQADIVDRQHFMSYAARTMRSVIVDFVRARQAQRRGGDLQFQTLNDEIADSVPREEDDVVRIGEALEALGQVDARAAQVVEMRFFAGMTEAEIAQVLGLTERTVRRDWEKARLMLRIALD